MDEEKRQERAKLIARLFTLLTAKLEDGAGIAADAQTRDLPPEQVHEAGNQLIELGREVMTLAEAIAGLNGGHDPG